MSTKPLFSEASLDDILRTVADYNDIPNTPRPTSDHQLVEIKPRGNGKRVIAVQDPDGNVLIDGGINNLDWDSLDDNVNETYESFLRNAAEENTERTQEDTILPLWNKTTTTNNKDNTHTTHVTDLAKDYINDNPDEFLTDLLDTPPEQVNTDTIHDDYTIQPFDNEQYLGHLQAHIQSVAPDLTKRRPALNEAAQAFRATINQHIDNAPLESRKDYFTGQFKDDDNTKHRQGIGSLAHDIIHWNNKHADNISAKALASTIKAQTYTEDYKDSIDEAKNFLHGSNEWLIHGAAHDFFTANDALLDQYQATKNTITPRDENTTTKVVNGAAIVEHPGKHQGSRQLLRQLIRHNWLTDEHGTTQGNDEHSYAETTPAQHYNSFHFNNSVISHVTQRERRYVNAIGTDILEQEVGRLGASYDNDDLVQASLRAITNGVPRDSKREEIFTSIQNDSYSLKHPGSTKQASHEPYLVQYIGTQLLANATIRAYSDRHELADPLA